MCRSSQFLDSTSDLESANCTPPSICLSRCRCLGMCRRKSDCDLTPNQTPEPKAPTFGNKLILSRKPMIQALNCKWEGCAPSTPPTPPAYLETRHTSLSRKPVIQAQFLHMGGKGEGSYLQIHASTVFAMRGGGGGMPQLPAHLQTRTRSLSAKPVIRA